MIEHHPLINDFPEHKSRIHDLKQSDHHFARLMNEYEAVDKEVVRVENGIEKLSDAQLEAMKVARLRLKDQLYALLSKP